MQEKFILEHLYHFLDGLQKFFTKHDLAIDLELLESDEVLADDLKKYADLSLAEFDLLLKLLYKKLVYEHRFLDDIGAIEYHGGYFCIVLNEQKLFICQTEEAVNSIQYTFGLQEKILLDDDSWVQD